MGKVFLPSAIAGVLVTFAVGIYNGNDGIDIVAIGAGVIVAFSMHTLLSSNSKK